MFYTHTYILITLEVLVGFLDDFITKKYILPMLRDPQKLKSLIEEHRATPIGRAATRDHSVIQHSQDLQTLLDKLRRGSKENGFVTICLKLHEDYRIGITTGVRGEPVEITEDSYSSEEACWAKKFKDLTESDETIKAMAKYYTCSFLFDG